MNRFTALVVVLGGLGCGGAATQRPAIELGWEPPDAEPVAAFAVNHPLRGVAEALEAGNCRAVVNDTQALQAALEDEIDRVLRVPPPPPSAPSERPPEGISGPLDMDGPTVGRPGIGRSARNSGVDAAAARRLLDETIYLRPPVLEVGEHGFHMPVWWSQGYAYCLAELGQLEDAAEVYTLMLWEGVDPDTLWRLALVNVWAGRPGAALSLLQSWPPNAARPAAYGPLLERLQRGEPVPFDTRTARLSLD